MKTNLDLTADMIDVRDIIARAEELESDALELLNADDDGGGESEPLDELSTHTTASDLIAAGMDSDDAEEIVMLRELLEELRGNGGDEQWRGDWYPGTLIRDSYFETAMDELLEDIGYLPKCLPCYLKITVDYVALQQDYTSVEIDGTGYLYR